MKWLNGMARGWLRVSSLAVFVASAVAACAGEAPPTDAGGDATVDVALPDGRTFETDAVVTCVVTKPVAVPSAVGAPSCLFDLIPPLPEAPDLFAGVTVDGAPLPAEEFALHGRDVLELTGQACVDYLAGAITNVAVNVLCADS